MEKYSVEGISEKYPSTLSLLARVKGYIISYYIFFLLSNSTARTRNKYPPAAVTIRLKFYRVRSLIIITNQ